MNKSIWQYEWVCHTCNKVGKSVSHKQTAQKRANEHNQRFDQKHKTEVKMFGSMFIRL